MRRASLKYVINNKAHVVGHLNSMDLINIGKMGHIITVVGVCWNISGYFALSYRNSEMSPLRKLVLLSVCLFPCLIQSLP